MLFNVALDGEKNGGGLINFPYLTGEQITGVETGQPAFLRELDANFSLANFMRVQLMSCLCALKIGFNLLTDKEGIEIHQLLGHGGFFNTKKVGQEIMSAATGYEVGVMETANEGGAWGMAILAAYTFLAKVSDQSLQEYLDSVIFKSTLVSSIKASTADIDGFNEYLTKFQNKLYIER